MTDLKFNTLYGDFSFNKTDIDLSYNNETLKELIIDRLNTGYNSYRLNDIIGAYLDSNVGKAISDNLINSIERSIIYSLTYDNIIESSALKLFILRTDNVNELYIRIHVQGNVPIDISRTLNIGVNNEILV